VILLTARGDDVDRIVGLEIGADDFVPKEKVNADLSKSLTKSKPGCTL
jgi:DNA-binding response OmpR family regulator